MNRMMSFIIDNIILWISVMTNFCCNESNELDEIYDIYSIIIIYILMKK